MDYLVAYDISENRIRNRLSKYILKYGIRLQKSVFLVSIEGYQYKPFIKGIEKIVGIDGEVALFRICRGCREKAVQLNKTSKRLHLF